MGGAVKDVLDKGDIGGCESLHGSAPKFPATFQLDLFDLCTPGQVTGTRHWIELGLQEIVRTDNSNHCFGFPFPWRILRQRKIIQKSGLAG